MAPVTKKQPFIFSPLVGASVALAALGAVVWVYPTLNRSDSLEYQAPIQAAGARDPATVLFVGDIMLDRAVADHAEEVGDQALFAGVRDLFDAPDLIVGNLEGAITNFAPVAEPGSPVLRFTFDPRMAPLLADVGFGAVSLANNHSFDFGAEGYRQTLAYLEDAGIAAFGSPRNSERLAVQLKLGDLLLCLVGYHSLYDPAYTAIVEKVREVRSTCDKVVVVAHWGEEYEHTPSSQQREAAHAFVDAGADLVIGAHPHIVQPLEVYQGKAIFYSLGNFLFDQYFQPEVMRGLAVGVTFGEASTRFALTPIYTVKEAAVAEGARAQAVLEDLLDENMPLDIRDSILAGGEFAL